MAPELGGSQISQLLESVPGIANVLRSPVADALVNMIRAGAGVGEFHLSDAAELVQYSVRRGLISADEGDRIMAEVAEAERRKRVRKRGRQRAKTAAGSKKRSTSPPKKTAKKPSRSKAAATKRTRGKSAKKARPSPRRKPTKRR